MTKIQHPNGLTWPGFCGMVPAASDRALSHTRKLMALNLIKVPTANGPVWIGVAKIIAILPNDSDHCIVHVEGYPLKALEAQCSAQAIVDAANRRPPDGF